MKTKLSPAQKQSLATLKFLQRFCSKDPIGQARAHIHISDDGKVLVATDGYRLAEVTLAESLPTEGNGNRVDTQFDARLKLGLLPTRLHVEDPFPDYRRLLPERHGKDANCLESQPSVVGFDGWLLGEITAGLADLGNAWDLEPGIRLQWPTDGHSPIRIEFGLMPKPPIVAVCLLMPQRISELT